MEKRSDGSNASGGNKKKILLAVLSVLIIAAGVFYFTVVKDNNLVKQADSLVAIGKYENGIAIYDAVLTKKMNVDVMAKRENAIDLMEATENYQQGVELLDNDDRYQAIKYFSKVPENDVKLYEKATDEIKDIEDMTASEIEELIAEKDFDTAYKIVNDYLKVAHNSTKISNLKETLIATEKDVNKKNAVAKAAADKKNAEEKSEQDKQVKAIEDARRNQEAKEIAAAKSKEIEQEELNKRHVTANNILYTYQTVVTDPGNLRAAPSLNGALLVALPRGTEVYIMDTHVENLKRTWCKVEVESYGEYYTGWISYNTMNYSLP